MGIRFRQACFRYGKFVEWRYWGYLSPKVFTPPLSLHYQREIGVEFKPSQQYIEPDKNGKEIYEGDVLKTVYSPRFIIDSVEVYWRNYEHFYDAWQLFPPEVVGHIYEGAE